MDDASAPPEEGDDAAAPSVEPAADTPLQQPANSAITVERFPDGLTITVPPAGLFKGTQGLFVFAIIWNGFIGILSPLFLLGIFSKPQDFWAYVFVPAILSIFLLVGIGLLLGAINMGRRRAAIAVTGGRLMVIQSGPFGTKQRDWAASEAEDVCAGPSGMTVNDKAILELQILSGEANKFGLLAGRSDDELKWLASELRGALDLTPKPVSASPTSDLGPRTSETDP